MTDKTSKGGKGGRDDKARKGGEANGPDALTASLRAVTPADRQLDLAVRLVKRADRALHYIADVRATRYDPTRRILTVSLSDEGREVIFRSRSGACQPSAMSTRAAKPRFT